MVQGERAKYAEKLGRLKVDDVHRLLDLMDIVPRGTGSKVRFLLCMALHGCPVQFICWTIRW